MSINAPKGLPPAAPIDPSIRRETAPTTAPEPTLELLKIKNMQLSLQQGIRDQTWVVEAKRHSAIYAECKVDVLLENGLPLEHPRVKSAVRQASKLFGEQVRAEAGLKALNGMLDLFNKRAEDASS
ncbi:hypothetical protein [uncultured Stenotrophomonas sp.]|uniref:hypothetical protein n=1 Tax=uncultured Stenotrophomonas sp. TaxID=165438 RepID=UPI0025FCC694|nr:hypothetical protein [uncultured Stenotrophomonas sp.]